ncbi:MAG: PIN domain-containing protein [Nostoc sp. CmiVER01]|uniref:PIN domain-containing protein n=1 Tax=Nostoc sp. CmiVER01 TaxID=3075384 RepID=UPI002AD5829C|nr:PIN domain-containing protein [Nostoc sp. CmiVER01]MDZ8125222.1 PIN domain-containing protein [Nostoc sp. CmiVER01]
MIQKIRQPTRLVALDTEVFDRENFNYQSTSFKKLIELVQDEKVCLYLTTVTQQEVMAHIEHLTQQASLAFKNLHKEFRKQAKIIHNSLKFKILLNLSLNKDELSDELKEQFNEFIKESQIEILTIDAVSAEYIFTKYFQILPPFENGQKKHEFPDAFAIAAIEEKAKTENRKIYIISGDPDWQKASSQSEYLIYKESIDKLLTEIIEQESSEVDLCYKILDDNWGEIKNEISHSFSSREFSLSDDFAHGYFELGSEYIEVVVEEIIIIDKSIVNIDEEVECPVVTFELKTEISCTLYISYDSTEYAYWDSEDHVYYGIEQVEGKVPYKLLIPVELEIILFRDESYNLSFNAIENVDLDPNGLIGTIVLTPGEFEEIEKEFDSCFF